jgi:pimeloyl-ACP methyl ester carboxylesterase
MDKKNLILIHSFPTNSVLLAGLTEYLNDYLNVYFIDLPGFIPDNPKLPKISWEGYISFVEDEIARLDLPSYIIGGISFGFVVANGVTHEAGKCEGVLAMEPFTGAQSLNFPAWQRVVLKLSLSGVSKLRLSYLLWKSRLLKSIIKATKRYPQWTIDILFEQVDAQTFFDTANMLLNDNAEHQFHDLPYVLIGNDEDDTIDFAYVQQLFKQKARRLLVIKTTIEHFPSDLSKAYFEKNVPQNTFNDIVTFINSKAAAS